MNIVHRDLKPDNIFISVGPDGVNNVKIGDFGLASKGLIAVEKGHSSVMDEADMTRSIGTSAYVAPEVKSGGSGNYTSKVDVGLLTLDILSSSQHQAKPRGHPFELPDTLAVAQEELLTF